MRTFLALLLFPLFAFAESQGPNFPTQAINYEVEEGHPDWIEPERALASDEFNTGAAYSFGGLEIQPTDYLVVSGFNFSIPSNATITDIIVYIERSDNSDEFELFHALDSEVRLVRRGVMVGENKAKSDILWTNTDVVIRYGAGLWGETWSVGNINDPSFGVAISTAFIGFEELMKSYVDAVSVQVFYSAPKTKGGT